MIRTQVYIPDDLHQSLVLLAKRDRVNVSQLLREGARQVIKNKKKKFSKKKSPLFGLIGMYKGQIKSNAVKDIHDYYTNEVV